MIKTRSIGPRFLVDKPSEKDIKEKKTKRPFKIKKARTRGKLEQLAVGASAFMGKTPARRQQVLSLGKDKPDPPQAALIITVFFPKSTREQRVANVKQYGDKDLLAPIGDHPTNFDVKQGVLVYAIRNDTHDQKNMPRIQQGSNAVSDIYAFDTVEGLRKGTRLRFIGWACTENKMSDTTTIATGAVAVIGACSATNTGPYTIEAMSQVYFDEQPCMIWDTNGRPIIGVKEIGFPIDKFRPAVYGFKQNDIQFTISKAIASVSAVVSTTVFKMEANRKESNTNMNGRDNLKDLLEATDVEINSVVLEKPKSFPLDKLLRCHVFSMALEALIMSPSATYHDPDEGMGNQSNNEHDSQKNLFDEYLIAESVYTTFVKPMKDERRSFNVCIGEDHKSQGPLFDAFNIEDTHRDTLYFSERQNVHNMITALKTIRLFLEWNLRAWYDEHFIGTCMNNAVSGEGMRLNLRFGRS